MRVLAMLYLIALHIVLAYFVGERLLTPYVSAPEIERSTIVDPTETKPLNTPIPVPSIFADELVAAAVEALEQPTHGDSNVPMIPVAGVRIDQLTDSFADARSNGRVHDAIDIMAPAGTPVLAAVDGEVIKFFDSVQGGITIYQASVDRKFMFYYAHLQRRSDDVKVGSSVKQGQTIGYVGDTGNSGAGNYHLHFSIAATTDPKRYWEGTYVNPFPILTGRAKL